MKRAYWISNVKVTDEVAYKRYAVIAKDAIAAFGGEFLVRGGAFVQLEGRERPRNVLVIFPSLAAAEACYKSDRYQKALFHAQGASERDLVIVEEA